MTRKYLIILFLVGWACSRTMGLENTGETPSAVGPGSPAPQLPSTSVASQVPSAGGANPGLPGAHQKPWPELEALALQQMQAAHLPGLVIAITLDGKVKWSNGFGVANLETQRKISPDMPLTVGSISKVFTGVALMMLVERQKIGLDIDISSLLGYSVRHPEYQEIVITPRMILTHVASISEANDEIGALLQHDRDSSANLRDFVQRFYRNNQQVFFPGQPPGQQWAYSNIGIATAGVLIEAASGMSFTEFIRHHIFQPLDMTRSSYMLRDFNINDIGTPYVWSNGQYETQPQYGRPDLPAANLRSSANDLAKFLANFVGSTKAPGGLLSQAAAAEMLKIPYPHLSLELPATAQGLTWRYKKIGTHQLIGHSGSMDGSFADMQFEPASGVGMVLITNGDWIENIDADSGAFGKIEALILSDPNKIRSISY